MTDFSVAALRPCFPSLSLRQNGVPVVYLDGPGGTQVPQRVIDAVAGYYREMNANDSGAFVTSRRSDAMLAEAHCAAADFINAASPEEVKFGLNMTTQTFSISRSIGATLEPGDEIVVTVLDHEANVSPWQALRERGVVIRTVDIREEGCTLDLDDLDRKLNSRTRLVAIGYASNAVGTVNPVKEIVRRAHAVGALAYVDAVHYAPHGPIDVAALDADFLVMSAYKFFGPHVGILYGKAEVLDRLPAYKVRPAHDRFELGTQNHEGIAGTLAAIEYLSEVGSRFGGAPAGATRRERLAAGMTAIKAYERTLSERLMVGLRRIPGVRVWGIADPARFGERTPTFAIRVGEMSPLETAERLGERGIFVWDGDFYAQALIERLGLFDTGGVVRIGMAHYNTPEEIDRLLEEIDLLAA